MKEVSSSRELPFAADAAFTSVRDVISRLAGRSLDGAVSLTVPVVVHKTNHLVDMSVPVQISLGKGSDPRTLTLEIEARAHDALFPHFRGSVDVQATAATRSVLRLRGRYEVPFGWIGERFNDTVIQGSAEVSLSMLLDRVTSEVARHIASRLVGQPHMPTEGRQNSAAPR
jgi:hypothetical protein